MHAAFLYLVLLFMNNDPRMARVKAQTDVKLKGESISINPEDRPRTKLGNSRKHRQRRSTLHMGQFLICIFMTYIHRSCSCKEVPQLFLVISCILKLINNL